MSGDSTTRTARTTSVGAARTAGTDRAAAGGRTGHILSGVAVALGCVLFLGGFGWGALLYRPYTVPTGSMTPTVDAGDRVLGQRIDGSAVRRGDVVVFTASLWGDVPMVKRVVAVGGDTVKCCDKQGRMTVNGKAVKEPYLNGGGPASLVNFETTVPKGELFMLGDNRATSEDSRARLTDTDSGSVPRSAVSARVDAKVWPLSRMGMLGHTGSASPFAGMPGGVSAPGPLRWIAAAVVTGAVLIFGGAAYGPVARRLGRRR
jgi:signal peptidase I